MGQHGLFGFAEDEQASEYPPAKLPDWTMEQKLAGEKEVLGIYVSGHPLDQFKDKLTDLSTHFTDKLEDLEKGTPVALCGILTGILRKTNREGRYWASMKVDDGRGTIDAMVFANRYEELLGALRDDAAVFIRASVLTEEGAPPKLSIQEMVTLEEARVDLPSLISIRVWLKDEAAMAKADALNELFVRKHGATEVRLRLEKPRDFSVVMDVKTKVRPDKEFRAELERICGPESLEILAS
jgi:DNA polymerase-3 subunit alpha